MKSRLLIATAIAAVLAGTGFAAAQQKEQHGAPAARSAPRAAAPQQHAPAAPPRAAIQHAPSAPPRAQVQRSAPVRTQTHVSEPRGPSFSRQNRTTEGREVETRGRAKVETRERVDKGRSRAEIRSGERNREIRSGERNREIRSGERNREVIERNRRETERTGTVERHRAATSLSSEQRTRIREVILRGRNAPRVAHPDFDIRVGYRIPRERLHFALLPLPSTIVDIEPTWEGYLYFLVGDEIVVVDPDTYEIVAVLPA